MIKLTNDQIESAYKNGCFVMMEKNISIKIARDCGLVCVGLYNIILMHKFNSNSDGCYPSYETLMRECNIGSKSTLTSYLTKLVNFGYLKIKSGNRGYCSTYYFPLADKKITNYTDEDLKRINSIKRKKGVSNKNVSDNSLYNLKNYKPNEQDNDDPF